MLVVSPKDRRVKLATVVALSTTPPDPILPIHYKLNLNLPKPFDQANECWVKGDMVYRLCLSRMNGFFKKQDGKREYFKFELSEQDLEKSVGCVVRALGVSY